jgi:hypothetical protein
VIIPFTVQEILDGQIARKLADRSRNCRNLPFDR